jgi:hypothetical protein
MVRKIKANEHTCSNGSRPSGARIESDRRLIPLHDNKVFKELQTCRAVPPGSSGTVMICPRCSSSTAKLSSKSPMSPQWFISIKTCRTTFVCLDAPQVFCQSVIKRRQFIQSVRSAQQSIEKEVRKRDLGHANNGDQDKTNVDDNAFVASLPENFTDKLKELQMLQI